VPTRRAILLTAVLIIGLGAGGAAGWYAGRDYLARAWVGISPYRAAVEGKLQTRLLRQLRQGDTEKAIATFETLLDANLMMLAQLEENGLPKDKVDEIYAAISEIRQYREKYPRDAGSPSAQEAITKALSLKRSGQGNAP
jgi:hypothetical protein